MIKKLSLLLSVLFLTQVGFSQNYSGGTGTKEDPFKIGTTEDLVNLSVLTINEEDYTKDLYFKQIADIEFVKDVDNGNLNPIGGVMGNDEEGKYIIRKFAGHYDGDGHSITNLCILKPDNMVALFPYLTKEAVVENINIKSAYIVGNGIVATIAGINEGQIINCSTDSKTTIMSAGSYIGGIVSNNQGTVSQCVNRAFVRSLSSGIIVGGIVSDNGGVINNCCNFGTTMASAYVGGIVGMARNNSQISYCYNMGKVSAKGNESAAGTGGIVGCISIDKNTDKNLVKSCYNAGAIQANSHAGAIIGNMLPIPKKEFQDNCYYDSMVSVAADTNATEKTTDELKAAAFLRLINDKDTGYFVEDTNNLNNGYPVLAFQNGELPSVNEKDELEAFDKNINALVGKYFYAIFLKKYPSKLMDYITNGGKKKIAIRLTTDDNNIIKTIDNKFTVLKSGSANLTISVSKPLEGTLDQFDENQILAKTTINVNGVNSDDFELPQIAPWLSSKDEAIKFETEHGFKNFTENYFEMISAAKENNPNATILLSNNFYLPIAVCSYSDDQNNPVLLQYDVYVNNREMMLAKESLICQKLENSGFKYLGTSSYTGGWSFYNEKTKTCAISSLISVQGIIYGLVTFGYDEDGSIAGDLIINEASDAVYNEADIHIKDNGNQSITIKSNNQLSGETINLYNLKGEKIASQTANAEGNMFDNLNEKYIIVKVGKYMPIKVILK